MQAKGGRKDSGTSTVDLSDFTKFLPGCQTAGLGISTLDFPKDEPGYEVFPSSYITNWLVPRLSTYTGQCLLRLQCGLKSHFCANSQTHPTGLITLRQLVTPPLHCDHLRIHFSWKREPKTVSSKFFMGCSFTQ